jgi:2-polyprenyl-3-methyl-5-hydroxy-6-metoxy-1,4-benzoquinol methylase
MAIGPIIRRAFGPYEYQISAAYRAIYIDIGQLALVTQRWVPTARNILEVGCGEGAVTEHLRTLYPYAAITAIDVTANLGRLYRGPREGLRFVQCQVEQVAATDAGVYDLVILSDVLHHVPHDLRQSLLESIRTTLAPDGSFIFKDWIRTATPIHWLSYASDRWLTGDRIAYLTHQEMLSSLRNTFGGTAVIAEERIAPWRNNIAMLVKP